MDDFRLAQYPDKQNPLTQKVRCLSNFTRMRTNNAVYYPATANTVQITVQIYSDIVSTIICTVENLFAVQVGARRQNCHTLRLSLINLLTTAVG